MKLAAQLYTIRDYTKTPEDIHESLKKIKEIGYNAVQVSAFGPIKPQLLKDYIDEFDLKICATHTPFNRIINETDAVIAEHKLWDCKYIGLGMMPQEYIGNKEGYDKFLEIINPVTEKIYSEGLKFVYHNHKAEFAKIDGKLTGIEYLASKTDKNKFGFLADFYWVQAGGASVLEYIKKYADRLDVVHFKDMTVVNNEITMAEIFEGNMDYDNIYSTCLNANIEWAAIEQDVSSHNPFDSLKISYDNLKSRGMF